MAGLLLLPIRIDPSNRHAGPHLLDLRVVPRSPPTKKRAEVLVVASASATGSSGEVFDKWLDQTRDKKRWSVAGINQEELVDPMMLADHDSLFYDFKDVRIHHKICHDQEQADGSVQLVDSSQLLETEKLKIMLPIILLHGFGASLFSWSRVMKPLAQLISSKVLAFDRPAFGLTSRNRYLGHSNPGKPGTAGLNPYSMAFSVLATLSFVDVLGSDKAILMGHSAGCFVAANSYLEAPERVAALILVAPAILAPFAQGRPSNIKKPESRLQIGFRDSDIPKNPIAGLWMGILNLIAGFVFLLMRLIKGVKDMLSILFKKVTSTFLRSSAAIILVRVLMDKFGIQFVKTSWYDASGVTDHVIQGYTKPLKAKNWEMALLEYTLSLLTDSSSKSKPPLTRRLSQISCPVLIITGDTDRVVPAWNARRLAAAIPGSTFEVIKNCGHLPHEEKPEEFLLVVNKFLQGVAESQKKI